MWQVLAEILPYWLYEVYTDSEHGTVRKVLAAAATIVLVVGLAVWIYLTWFR